MKYDDIKKTAKYRVYRFLWIKFREISSWAGKKCISMLKKADNS